jgi:hypothetical protein
MVLSYVLKDTAMGKRMMSLFPFPPSLSPLLASMLHNSLSFFFIIKITTISIVVFVSRIQDFLEYYCLVLEKSAE